MPSKSESIPEMERENPDRPEFLVADGNHRIVQRCWIDGQAIAAVLIEKASQPYYAYPFAAREWWLTAENRLVVPPDLYSKYAPRRYPGDPGKDSYRTWFRDFNSGFKNVGGQGGHAL